MQTQTHYKHLFLLFSEVWISAEKFETLKTFKANFIHLQVGTEQQLEKNLKSCLHVISLNYDSSIKTSHIQQQPKWENLH